MRLFRYALVIACLVVLGACTGESPRAPEKSTASEQARSSSPALPDGWRWESHMGVQVGVPDDWGWGSGDQRLGQWCINEKSPKPIVGRPGITTLVGCPRGEAGQPDPETLISNTGWIVAFEPAAFADGSKNRIARGGDRELVRAGDTWVVVQAPPALRARVARTVHEVKVDDAGCPVSDPVSLHPDRRPRPASDVADLVGVTSVSVCKYAIVQEGEPHTGASLLSSLRYRGTPAARIIQQIGAAAKGGGPNEPARCTESYGTEIIVLRVTSAAGASEVYVRYDTCDRLGFDDGVSVRTLTRDPMQALIKGPNALSGWDGHLSSILEP